MTGHPLQDRRAQRSAAAAAREEPLALLRELLAAETAFAEVTWGEAWLAGIRRSGCSAGAPTRRLRLARVAIANRLIAEVGAQPLLMGAADYQAVARSGQAAPDLTGARSPLPGIRR